MSQFIDILSLDWNLRKTKIYFLFKPVSILNIIFSVLMRNPIMNFKVFCGEKIKEAVKYCGHRKFKCSVYGRQLMSFLNPTLDINSGILSA